MAYTTELRKELSETKHYGYVTVDNLVQLSSFCGILPAICYTTKELPNSNSSGSNQFVTMNMSTPSKTYKEKNSEFKSCVSKIQMCSSVRLFESDIENGMCELDRDRRHRRKKECIFLDKSSGNLQDFFRIHKTNITEFNTVTKYQVQMLHDGKWFCVYKEIIPTYEQWTNDDKIIEDNHMTNYLRGTECKKIDFHKPF